MPRLLTCGDAIAGSGWPASSRNGGRHQIGTVAGFISESVAGFNRNPHDGGRSSLGAGLSTSDYINRTEGAIDDELGVHILITLGLPVDTGAALARLLDARERKRDRTYRCYGGRLPRVGTHLILSFRYGLSTESATEAAWEHARMLSDRLRVPLEGRVHNKNGAPDHLHLIVGTRVVDHGKLGRKCRELDAVSEKHDGKPLVEGVLGPTIEALRADWAERMRRASGDTEIDHRSYTRRGMAIYPVAHVPRGEIEYQKRRGRTDWRRERGLELQARAPVLRTEATGRPQGPAETEAAEPARASRQHAPDAASPAAGADPGSVAAVRQRPTDARTLPAWDGDDRASRDRRAQRVEPDRDTLTPGVDAVPMIAVHRALRAAHRLKADRERALANLAGIDVEALRRASAEAVDNGEDAAAGKAPPLPSELMKLVVVWQGEDRRARAERRRDKDTRREVAAIAAPPSVPETPPGPSPRDGPAGLPPEHGAARPAAPPHNSKPRPQRAFPASGPTPAPGVYAGPGAIAGSEALARALHDAHAASAIESAYDNDRLPPSDEELLRKVALRLRASGLDRDEVGRYLRTGDPAENRDASAGAVTRAVNHAFSERSTAWLAAAPKFVTRAERVSGRAETALYRWLRADALQQLKRDLDEVWVTRRARADEVAERHRRRMAWIRDLRWSNRRLQRRGLILAILSVAVELAILRPLVALDRVDTTQQHRDLNDAARAATERLRALRNEWRTAHSVVRAPTALNDDRGEPDQGKPGASPTSARKNLDRDNPHASGHATAGRPGIERAGQPDREARVVGLQPAFDKRQDRPIVEDEGYAAERAIPIRRHTDSRTGDHATPGELAIARVHLPVAPAEATRREAPERPSAAATAPDDAVLRRRSAHVLASARKPGEPDGRPSFHKLLTATGPEPSSAGDVEASPPAAGTVPGRDGPRLRGEQRSASASAEAEQQRVAHVEPLTRIVADLASGAFPSVPTASSRPAGDVAPEPSARHAVPESSTPPTSIAAPSRATEQPRNPSKLNVPAMPLVELPVFVERRGMPGIGQGSAGPHGEGEGPHLHPAAEVRHRLVARYALVLAACNAWSDDRKRRLATLAPVDPGKLWGLAINECRACFGHGKPSTIARPEASRLLDAVLREAEYVGFVALPTLRHAFLGEKRRIRKGRGGRDDDPGEL